MVDVRINQNTYNMKKQSILLFGIILLSLYSFFACNQQEQVKGENLLVIENVNLIDGNGGPVVANSAVVVENNKIIRLGSVGDYSYPDDATIMNMTGKYLLPGFINTHFHIGKQYCEEVMSTVLGFGITSIKDPGCLAGFSFNLNLKQKLLNGEITGPKLLTSGEIINGHSIYDGYPGIIPLSTEEEVRLEIQRQIKAGADFIKVFIHLPPELVKVAINEATKHGIKVIGHLGKTSWTQAAKYGISDLCHAHFLMSCWELIPESQQDDYAGLYYPPPDNSTYLNKMRSWGQLVENDSPEMKNLISALVDNNVIVTPTFVAEEIQIWGDNEATRELYEPDYAPDELTKMWRNQPKQGNTINWTPEYHKVFKEIWPKSIEIIRQFHINGVLLSAGTDYVLGWISPGFSFHRELELMVKAGIPPIEVLTIATKNGALNLGIIDKVGTIEEGKIADIVILSKDPIENIKNTRSIYKVIRNGKMFDPDLLLKK